MHIVPINFKRRSKIWRVLCLLLIEREGDYIVPRNERN
jgi:hypothetical protein